MGAPVSLPIAPAKAKPIHGVALGDRLFVTGGKWLLLLLLTVAVLAVAIGQMFGDKFTFAALWRSTALLGGAWIGLVLAVSQWRLPWPVSLFFVAVGAGFVTLALWFLPRVADLGFIDFPEAAWGVHLYRAP